VQTSDNQGWRIARIPTRRETKPRAVYGTAILLLLALLLVVALVTLPLVPLIREARNVAQFLSLLTAAHIILLAMGLLLVVPLAWIVTTSARQLRGKGPRVEVEAHCHDRDIQPVVNFTDAGEVHGWTYRLLCEFEVYGRAYEATPEGRQGKAFRIFETPQEVEMYLDTHIGVEGECRLRVDPSDPVEAELVERRT